MKRSALALALLATPAAAQTQFYPPVGSAPVAGVVQMCLNAANQAVPVSSGSCANGNGTSSTPSSTAVTPSAGSQEQDVRSSGTIDATKTSGSTSYIDIPVNGQSSIGLRFSGLTASGAVISYQQSVDGGTTYTPMAENNTGTGALSLTRSTDGQVGVNAARRTNVRLQVTTAGTGTVSVAWTVSVRPFALAVDAPLPPGTNTIGAVNLAALNGAATAANQAAGTGVNGTPQAGGVAPLARIVSSAANTNATLAKAAPGRVYRIFGCNTTTAAVYLKLYNTATAPTVGTTAVFLSRPFPAAGAAGGLACQSFDVADIGWSFSAGIAFAVTTGNADADATAPAAGALVQFSLDGQ